MIPLTILRDNREQKPWEFEGYPVTIRGETINTGDYTLAEFCDHDPENDTYYPRFAIERKGGQDFVQSITRGRDRFRDEIKRASDWDSELRVLIEETRATYKRQRKFMKYRDVTWSQIKGTIDNWEKYYNVTFEFVGTREQAQQETFDAFSSRLGSVLTSGE